MRDAIAAGLINPEGTRLTARGKCLEQHITRLALPQRDEVWVIPCSTE
jgi:hypothetical protein